MFRNRINWFRIQDFDDKKNLQLGKNLNYFDQNFAIYLSLDLHKGRLSNRRSLQPSKGNIQHFIISNFLTFSYYVGHFSPPDPDPLTGSNSDPKHWRADRLLNIYKLCYGSGSVRSWASWIRIRIWKKPDTLVRAWIRGSGSEPKRHGSTTNECNPREQNIIHMYS